MKLRVRSIESKQTQRIEVPDTYNLPQLKQTIILQVLPSSSSSSSSATPVNLLLSLNRKDELCGSSPEESLQSIGLTSGDLIYYTQNPYAFTSQTLNLSHHQMEKPLEINHGSCENVDVMNTQKIESAKFDELIAHSDETRELADTQMEKPLEINHGSCKHVDLMNTQRTESANCDELIADSDETRELVDTQMEGSSNLSNPNDQTQDLGNFHKEEGVEIRTQVENLIDETEGTDEMEVDDESVVVKTRFSVPSFLKKVFVKEVGDVANGGDHKLLVIAVHAVLLESGFVGYDPVSGMKVDGFHLSDEWPSSVSGISLHYTLPEVSSSEVVETVVLKFSTLGKFINVFGSLCKQGFVAHHVRLDKPWLLPALNFIWKMSDYTDPNIERDDSAKLYPNKEIFEFWKIVKDGLSYPLLIDLCEKVGVVPPPCFMRLPTELKLKILESLPAVDIAKVACVCSELRFISSNNDLWRMKYEEEFGNAVQSQRECQWKAKFSSSWEVRKKRKRLCVPLPWREPPHFRPLFPGRRDPNPLGPPFIIGGDYDRLPAFGIPQPPGRRIFRWNCGFSP